MTALIAIVGWLYANVLGNLVASLIWGVPALYIHYRRTRAHHRRILDEVREHLHGGCTCDDPLVQVSGQDSPAMVAPVPGADSTSSG